MSFGIAFAQQNRSMQDRAWQYDTNRPKLTVDPRDGYLQIQELTGGTPWTINPADKKSEILFQFQHDLPWPPAFLCYFYIEDAPSARASFVNLYSGDVAWMETDDVQWDEVVAASVDENYFYIKHFANYQAGSGAVTTWGNQYKFRVRFEIMDHQAVYTGQDVTG